MEILNQKWDLWNKHATSIFGIAIRVDVPCGYVACSCNVIHAGVPPDVHALAQEKGDFRDPPCMNMMISKKHDVSKKNTLSTHSDKTLAGMNRRGFRALVYY